MIRAPVLAATDVTFSAPDTGVVTITVELNDGWRFALNPVDEENGFPVFDNNIKVQNYDGTPPAGNLAPVFFRRRKPVDNPGPSPGINDLFRRGEDLLPVVLHADDDPAVAFGLFHQRRRERAKMCIRQVVGRAVGVFAFAIVVQHQHH